MASATSYNICYCSESESGSSVSDSFDESNHDKPFHRRSTPSYEQPNMDDLESAASVKEAISKIRKKYNRDEALVPENENVSSTTSDLEQENLLPNGNPDSSSSSLSTGDLHPNGIINNSRSKSSKKHKKQKVEKNSSTLNDDSDTMQEDAEFSSTTIQELDQAWDVYQEPLYTTGSDLADEERLDPSSLIGDWDGSMDEDNTIVVDQVRGKSEFDWSEDSDTEDINKLIDNSRMQLNIICEVLKELESDYLSVSCSDYIESCATCKTNIGCLEDLLAAMNSSMTDEEDNDYVNSLIELLNNWKKTAKQLEEIERPKQLGQKSKVRKRLKKKKMFRKFSCDSRKESLDPERLQSFAKAVLGNRSGSMPQVEFIHSLDEVNEEKNDNNDNNNNKSFVADQKVEGDSQLMSALFFGLIALILAIKIGYSCYADVDIFSFDVTFFIKYLRANPPA